MLDMSDKFQRRTVLSQIGYNLSSWLGVVCILSVAGPIFLVFEFFEKVAPWTRYHRAYAAKVCERPVSRLRPILHHVHRAFLVARWDRPREFKSRHLERQRPSDIEMAISVKGPSSAPPIMAICKYDVAVILSQQMHYVDLVNLSQTCRAWYQCLFPEGVEVSKQQERFRGYTCGEDRSECWSCTNTICTGCYESRNKVQQDITPFHIDRCVPYCKTCFRRLMRSNVRRAGCRSHKDRCETVCICSICARNTHYPFMLNGSRKWKHRLKKHCMSIKACGNCAEPLAEEGPRWWVVCTPCSQTVSFQQSQFELSAVSSSHNIHRL